MKPALKKLRNHPTRDMIDSLKKQCDDCTCTTTALEGKKWKCDDCHLVAQSRKLFGYDVIRATPVKFHLSIQRGYDGSRQFK
jgi:hypothetical protein